MISQVADHRFEKGRGAQFNPQSRFQKTSYACAFPEGIDNWESEDRKTEYIYDYGQTIVNKVNSPDLGMEFSLNPYQGCEHGCIYCYARNTHEYWGYSAGVDFESKIVIKKNAPALLRKFLDKKNWVPTPIFLSGNTDCYQPIERKHKITRAILEICLEYRNPVSILTKNALILRDIDILQEMARHNLVSVATSVSATDEELRRILEPRTTTYKSRLQVIAELSKAGVPTGVMNAPIIPGINDIHMSEVLKAASRAGAKWAGYTVVRLNGAVADIFKDWLYKTFPERGDKVWKSISDCHGGSVSDSRFGERMVGEGNVAKMIADQFKLYCKKYHLNEEKAPLNTSLFRRVSDRQLSLF